MIVDRVRRRAISNQGWIDKGSLWIFDLNAPQPTVVELSEAEFLALHRGSDDHFAAVHYFRGRRLRISVHTTRQPERELASCEIGKDGEHRFTGEAVPWASVPRYYAAYLTAEVAPENGSYLVQLKTQPLSLEMHRLSWFNTASYDLGYQSVIGAVEIPGDSSLLIPIQRDSQPVMYDPGSQQVLGHLTLAGRYGNPSLQFRTERELWADDYDTLVRLNVEGWAVTASVRLQPETADGMRQFIGGFDFTGDRSRCAVARPFSGDVALIDAERFEVTDYRLTGGQPLQIAVLDGGHIICREWKTGALLRARV